MIDINRIRNDPQTISAALAKRMPAVEFTELLAWDERRRALIVEADTLKARRNEVSRDIPRLKKSGESVDSLLAEMKSVAAEVKQLDAERSELEKRIRGFLEQLPNIPDDDVAGGGKEHNRVVRTVGKAPSFDFTPRDHYTLASELGIVDFERGVKLAGNGFWVYCGRGAQLELALINFFVSRHVAAGYELLLLPHIVNYECGYVAGQFPKFGDQDIFQLQNDSFDGTDGTDGTDGAGTQRHILIPTAETALAALHRDEILDAETLPRRYCAFTPCYRKEAGSYRSHDRGTIRGHQFNKVELFQYVAPDRSDAALDELTQAAEQLVSDLGLHYQVSLLAAGDCSAAAAKTYDIEVWVPSMDSYEEVSSASNTRDYQARRGRTRSRSDAGVQLVHTLNASGLATSRLLPALLETWQRADGGLTVPEVLRPFTGFDEIPPVVD